MLTKIFTNKPRGIAKNCLATNGIIILFSMHRTLCYSKKEPPRVTIMPNALAMAMYAIVSPLMPRLDGSAK